MASDETTDPRDAEIARLNETLDRTERTMTEALQAQGYALRKMHAAEAEIARLREENAQLRQSIEDDVGRYCVHHTDRERHACRAGCPVCERAQLAAAQADNAALRGAWSALAMIPDERGVPMSAKMRAEMLSDAIRDYAAEALATPAPGAALVNAVQALCAAVESGMHPIKPGQTLSAALAAVRAHLSPTQDTAPVSRQGDT